MNKDKGVVFIVARVTFDKELCKGCELCVSVCPVKIILMDRDRVNKNGYHPATVHEMDKCTGCRACAMMCPDVVIEVEK